MAVTRTDTDTVHDADGNLVSSVQVVRDITVETTVAALTDVAQAVAALDANIAYLASTPTQAQVGAQVKALTRQVDRLIRYTLGQVHPELFDSTEGT